MTTTSKRFFAIYKHSSGQGYVVRECDHLGFAIDTHNYRDALPQREKSGQAFVWKNRNAAEKVANRMSGL